MMQEPTFKNSENPENLQPSTRLEEAQKAISVSEEKVEQEFQRTANPWLACFGSRVFVIETLLYGKRAEDELGTETYNDLQQKMEILKQRLFDLNQQYPDKNTVPPEETKMELFHLLGELK